MWRNKVVALSELSSGTLSIILWVVARTLRPVAELKEKEISLVQIFDLVGNIIFSNSPNRNITYIDVSRLEKGMFIVEITSDSESFSHKLLIE